MQITVKPRLSQQFLVVIETNYGERDDERTVLLAAALDGFFGECYCDLDCAQSIMRSLRSNGWTRWERIAWLRPSRYFAILDRDQLIAVLADGDADSPMPNGIEEPKWFSSWSEYLYANYPEWFASPDCALCAGHGHIPSNPTHKTCSCCAESNPIPSELLPR